MLSMFVYGSSWILVDGPRLQHGIYGRKMVCGYLNSKRSTFFWLFQSKIETFGFQSKSLGCFFLAKTHISLKKLYE